MAQIDEKYLKGLKFTGAESEIVEVNGKKKTKWTPFKRPMKPQDVLAFKEKGDEVVIVAKDGKKHIVAKAAK